MFSLARGQFNRADLAQQFERRVAIDLRDGDNFSARLAMCGYGEFVSAVDHWADKSAWLPL